MTSEGPHRTGQEPDEVSPGAGGPAPYGDRPAQPDNGQNANGPDLGWAPRPDAVQPVGAGLGDPTRAAARPAWCRRPQPNDPAQPAWAAGGGTSEPPQQQPGSWPGNDGASAPAQPDPGPLSSRAGHRPSRAHPPHLDSKHP
ncbi:hypothetical protein NKG94_35285 [Micromonospora sp. M12]